MGSTSSAIVDFDAGEFYLEENPFAFGTSRRSFKAVGRGGQFDKQLVCVKLPKETVFRYFENWKMDVSVLDLAKECLGQYKHDHKLDDNFDVDVNNATIGVVKRQATFNLFGFIPFKKGVFTEGITVMVENYIEGVFEKWNSNFGYVRQPINNFPQAFSHYSWYHFKGTKLICDLQGVRRVNQNTIKYIITDPAIHSIERKYGSTDLGLIGMISFFNTHVCNDLCSKLPKIKIDDDNKVIASKASQQIHNVPTRYILSPRELGFSDDEIIRLTEMYQKQLALFNV